MTISKDKSMEFKESASPSQLLSEKLYDLKRVFEASYSGQLRSQKYEETREFTIALNFAIFQANQIELDEKTTAKSFSDVLNTFKTIKQDYQKLIQ